MANKATGTLRSAGTLLFAAFLAARLAWLWRLFFGAARGFYFWSGDYPTRVLIAEQWSRRPFWGLTQTIWLPVSTYLTGTVLRFFPETSTSPAVFHILLSTGVVAFVYGLARELWGDERAALAAAAWAGLETTLTLLSIAGGASELDYQFFLLGGVYFWLRRRRTGARADLWAAAALLALAGGTRHEAWCFMAWPAVSLLKRAWAARARPARAAEVLAALALLWLPAGAWLAAHALQGLFPLVPGSGLVANLRDGIRSAHGGRWGFFSKALWIYPSTWWNVSPLESLAAPAAAAWAWKRGGRGRELAAWASSSFVWLMLTPLASQFLPSFFDQVVLPYRLLAAPLWLGGALALLRAPALFGRRPALAGAAALAVVLAAGTVVQARLPARLPRYVPDHPDTYELGVTLLRRRRDGAVPADRPYVLFETFTRVAPEDGNRIWAVNVARLADTDVWPDRRGAQVIAYADDGGARLAQPGRGMLELPEPALREGLRRQRVGLVVAHTPQARRALTRLWDSAGAIGVYELFRPRQALEAAR